MSVDVENTKTNGLAIASFVLGIITLPCLILPVISPLLGLIAIVLGIVALTQLKTRMEKGKVFAILGIIFGVLFGIFPMLIILALTLLSPSIGNVVSNIIREIQP